MFAKISAIRREEKDGAIKCAAFAFDNTHDEINVVGPRDTREMIDGRPRNVHAAFPITLKIATAFVGTIADDGAEVEPTRIRRDKRFRENHEARALCGGFCAKRRRFFKSAFTIERDRSGLDDGGFEWICAC